MLVYVLNVIPCIHRPTLTLDDLQAFLFALKRIALKRSACFWMAYPVSPGVPWCSERVWAQNRAVASVHHTCPILTNLCMALYCILLHCVVLKSLVLLIYCYVDTLRYNTMHKFVRVSDNTLFTLCFTVLAVTTPKCRINNSKTLCFLSLSFLMFF